MTINLVGKIPGRIGAQHMTVERKSDIQCFRRVRVTNIDIKGRMPGEIVKSIAIEKGGMFSGQLVIGQGNLTQGELLPESKAAEKNSESGVPLGAAQPLHAT